MASSSSETPTGTSSHDEPTADEASNSDPSLEIDVRPYLCSRYHP